MTSPGDDNLPDLSKLGEAWDVDELRKMVAEFKQNGTLINNIAAAHVMLATLTQYVLGGEKMDVSHSAKFDFVTKTGEIVFKFQPIADDAPSNPLDPSG